MHGTTWMFLTVFLFCGLASVWLGFVAAIWFVGKCNHHATDDAVELPALDSDAELTRQQALLASDRLADLTQQVTRDVNAHSTKVESISVTLCEVEPDSISGEPAVLIARDQLVAANAELQNQLARAESQIKAQAEQLRARASEARTDILTKLPNRRVFEDELRKRFSEWERKQTPFTLLMVDIDHFKRFNDTHGHQTGDEVLKQVADVLKDQAREMDIVCRYGGEEFAVVLSATNAPEGFIVAERMRKAISTAEMRSNENCLQVTVSIGVAEIVTAESPFNLIRRADEALYLSKQAGRNCVRGHYGIEPAKRLPAGASIGLSTKPVDRKRSANRLASITELTRELARLVSESQRTVRPLSATCIKLDDSESLVRRHGEFAVGRLLDAAAHPIVPQLKESDVLGQTAHDELIVLLPGRSRAEASQLSKAIRFRTTNGTFNVVDRDLRARFRCETCELLSHETAEDFLIRVRSQVLALVTN